MVKRKETTQSTLQAGKRQKKGSAGKSVEEALLGEDYASKDYWNNRYCEPCQPTTTNTAETSDILSHEWYYTFDDLAPLLLKQDIFRLRSNDSHHWKVLEVGCGNKPLLPSFPLLLDPKNGNIPYLEKNQLFGIDFSETVITQLAQSENQIHYQCMDARNLLYSANHFDIILDKGTMDAMLSEKSRKKGIANAQAMIREMVRCLSPHSGLLLIVSHITPDSEEFSTFLEEILMPSFLNEKQGVIWKLHIHSAESSDEEEEDGEDGDEAEGGGKSGYGTVYCITCQERKVTRSREQLANEVFVEYFEY